MRRGDEISKDLVTEGFEPHRLGFQKANSYLEGLDVKCFHDNENFPWIKAIEESWPTIRDELKAVLGDESKLNQGTNVWVGPLAGDEVGKQYGEGWKTLGLYDRAEWEESNLALFPETTKALVASGCPLVEALFARMSPGSQINAHSDLSNFVLTAHLGVDVPAGKCWIQVGSERRTWEDGKVLLFDTSVLHEAANTSEDLNRYVLMLRVWHPGTSEEEREALQFVFDACADADLVASEEQLFMYTKLAQARKDYYAGVISKL